MFLIEIKLKENTVIRLDVQNRLEHKNWESD